MRFIFLIQLFSILLFSCSNTATREKKENLIKESDLVLTENLKNLFLGISNTYDSSNILETAIYFLNKSMYREAIRILRLHYNVDTVKVGGFLGYKEAENSAKNPYWLYTFFRLNDYTDNITGNELESELIGSLVDSNDKLFFLQNLEDSYLSIKKENNLNEANVLISQIRAFKKKFPNAKRLDFILANEFLITNDSSNAIKIFDQLIQEDYYALPSLRNLTRYLAVHQSPLLYRYVTILNSKFPSECNLVLLNRSLKYSSIDSFHILYNNCIQSSFQRDSVYAKLLLTKYYLNSKKLNIVDSIVNEYLNNIDNETYDSTVLYEKGNYFDLKMRVLFLRGKYDDLCHFAKTKLELNPIVTIDNEAELKFYMEELYKDYITTDTKDFNSFFEKNFQRCY